jgi:hypothetical protein
MATTKQSPTIKIDVSAEEYRAFRRWLIDHDERAATYLGKHIRRLIKKDNYVGRAGEMNDHEDGT